MINLKINEVLQKENIGKKFKFSVDNESYRVKEISTELFDLCDENGDYLTDVVNLSEILNGDFKEIQIYKLTRIEYELFKSLKRCCGYCNECGIANSCDYIENIIKDRLNISQLSEVDEEYIKIID